MYTETEIQKVKEEILRLEKEPMLDFNAHLLPKRNADTMSDAIALTSPDGKISETAKNRATKRLGNALFGNYTPEIRHAPETAHKLRELRHACRMMDMANRYPRSRKYKKEAERILQVYGK
jgi:hypothetical protein